MASWAVRYRAGEHRQVWDEMRGAGALAEDDTRRADAEAVVEQTVAIIENNLRLIERELLALGYQFLNPAPGASVTNMAGAIENSAAEALLSHPGLSDVEKKSFLANLPGLIGSVFGPAPERPPAPSRNSAFGDPSTHRDSVQAYREMDGPLPLLLDAFWGRIGWVDFLGGFDAVPSGELRPLSIVPPLGIDEDYDQHLDDADEDDPFYLDLMPDPRSVDADDPLMAVPLRDGVDLRLPDGGWLLDHIRRAVAGGGFLSPEATGPRRSELEAIAAACAPF